MFQFHIDKKPAAPIRATVSEAALDALESGFARPDNVGRIVLDDAADILPIDRAKALH